MKYRLIYFIVSLILFVAGLYFFYHSLVLLSQKNFLPGLISILIAFFSSKIGMDLARLVILSHEDR